MLLALAVGLGAGGISLAAAATPPLSPVPPVHLPTATPKAAPPKRASPSESGSGSPATLPASGGEPLAIALVGAGLLGLGLALRLSVARDGP